MKVLDLQCSGRHCFEGWFASEEDFQDQLARKLVACPVCADCDITKMLSAPRLNLGAALAPREAATAGPAEAQDAAADKGKSKESASADGPARSVMSGPDERMLQAAWLRMARHVMANTEDVGDRFAEEARKIHYGEADERGIRGKATAQETEALAEEGIAVMPLPLPSVLKETLQ